jgi:hypothetical protein
MTTILVAGSPLSASAFHCAGVGAGWAIAEADRTNSAHWRAAEEEKQGYRLPCKPTVDLSQIESTVNTTVVTAAAARPDLSIPDDLTIPDFLRRGPIIISGAILADSIGDEFTEFSDEFTKFSADTTTAAKKAAALSGDGRHSNGRL